MECTDPFNLERFVEAQASVHATALAELRAGRKRTHWMWFVFPQLRGLGRSSHSQYYGLASIDEAQAYLAHPLLGPRLVECTQAVLAAEAETLDEIFGSPDDQKFRSSMTLFEAAAESAEHPFDEALDRLAAGQRDAATLALLRSAGPTARL